MSWKDVVDNITFEYYTLSYYLTLFRVMVCGVNVIMLVNDLWYRYKRQYHCFNQKYSPFLMCIWY